ncbi:MAG: hypothetical protein IJ170_06980 [Ruminococcus sp.]|nr:hypothetical protein [Ruminococcus sp.]
MGIYAEKREKLIEKIGELEKRITSDTAKKKTLEDKLKEVSRLAMAEKYNCKPRELDDIISSEHTLLQKLRASGLSDDELLKLVGDENIISEKSNFANLATGLGEQMNFADKASPYED